MPLRRSIKTFLYSFCLLVSILPAHASLLEENSRIRTGYFGESLLHPGVQVGVETQLGKYFYYAYDTSYYLHYRNHHAFLFYGSIGVRKTFSWGYSMDAELSLGYMHAFPQGGDIYTVDDSGKADSSFNFGYGAISPRVSLGLLGFEWKYSNGKRIRVYNNLILFGQYPYNGYIYPRIALSSGVSF